METSEESLFETLTKTNYIYVHECTVLKRNAPLTWLSNRLKL